MPNLYSAFDTHVPRHFVSMEFNSDHSPIAMSNPSNWDDWRRAQCIVVLGEPGIGKSTEFKYQMERLRSVGANVFFTDWQEWIPGNDIFTSLEQPKLIQSLLEQEKEVVWFVDAIDEGRIRSQDAFECLWKGIRTLRDLGHLPLLKLRISCRSREWRDSDVSSLHKLFKVQERAPDTLVVLQLEPLSRNAIAALAIKKLGSDTAGEKFAEAMERRHVTTLAGQPLLLAMMLELYANDEASLGSNRTDLYDKAVNLLSSEQNPTRNGSAYHARTFPKQRVKLARTIAVHSIFRGVDTLISPETDSTPFVALSAESFGTDRKTLMETLNTGIFTRQAHGGFRFRHRSIGEFLAAQEIAKRLSDGMPLGKVLPLFPIVHGHLPSLLRETAAWLAGLNTRFRAWLCSQDPLTAAHGDTILYSAEERTYLITSLANMFDGKRWQNEFNRFGDLAQSVPMELMRNLLGCDRSQAVRSMAIQIIGAARRKELFDDLLDIALDPTDALATRVLATDILMRADVKKYSAEFISLIAIADPQDPADEIAGTVLVSAYPEYIPLDVALSSLRFTRQPNMIGTYRMFWSSHFISRTSTDSSSRQKILSALNTLLSCELEWHIADTYVEIFTELLSVEIGSRTNNMPSIGAWLQTAERANHSMGVKVSHLENLTTLIAKNRSFKREYLSWYFGSHLPPPQRTAWSELPFYDCFIGPADGDIWVDLAFQFKNDLPRGETLFREVIIFAQDQPESVSVDRIEELAALNPTYGSLWEKLKVWDLEDPTIKIMRSSFQQRSLVPVRRDNNAEIAIHNIEQIRMGELNALSWVVSVTGLQPLSKPDMNTIDTRWGRDIADALDQGFHKHWSSLSDTSELWPLGDGINMQVVVADMACSHAFPNLDESIVLSESQIDFLVWRCLYYDSFEDLGTFLWEFHGAALWRRLEPTLSATSDSMAGSNSRAWERIAATRPLPSTFVVAIEQYVLRKGLPSHVNIRKKVLSIVLRPRSPDLVEFLRSQVSVDWTATGRIESSSETQAIVTLAAFWLCDPAHAIETIRTIVFRGERWRPRAITFTKAIYEIWGKHLSVSTEWSSSVAFEAYAALLPLLFIDGEDSNKGTIHGFLTEDDVFVRAREGLISYLSKAPAEQASKWFAVWKDDPRFGDLREWINSLYLELSQRSVDEAWVPLTSNEAEELLAHGKFLVKNPSDLTYLISDAIEFDVGPTFRSDHGLVQLLWDGTKSEGNRKHRSEPHLQTALFAQLMSALKGRPLVGAREPELFDAKKPDARISTITSDGVMVHVPIEIKWSNHDELWNAPASQVIRKYLLEPGTSHAVYVVAWAGVDLVKPGPNGERPISPEELSKQLQHVVDAGLKTSTKTIKVHVVDASIVA